MLQSYEEALGALTGNNVFNSKGIARWPHHEFLFLYPEISILPRHSECVVPPPLNHELREEPTRSRLKNMGMLTFSSLSLANKGFNARDRRSITKKDFSKAIDTQSRFEGCSVVRMVTYNNKPDNGTDSAEADSSPRFQICLQHVDKQKGRPGKLYSYGYTFTEFYKLHDKQSCNDQCRHWWHNLEELFLRSNDRAYFEVQQYVECQGYSLPPVTWNSTLQTQHKSIWEKIAAKNEHYFTQQLPGLSPSATKLRIYECGLVSYESATMKQATNSKLKRRRSKLGRSEIALGKITINRDDLLPGIDYLLQIEQNNYPKPHRLAPMFSDEAEVMVDTMKKNITHRQGWIYAPQHLAQLLVEDVMRALAESSIPPVNIEEDAEANVKMMPGFMEFMARFVNGFMNWCLDPNRQTSHVFFDPEEMWEDPREAADNGPAGQGTPERARKSRRVANRTKENSRAELEIAARCGDDCNADAVG